MPMEPALSAEELQALRSLTTCQVADAIETFDVRLRNEGFMDGSIRCMFPNLAPMVGYAVTGRARTSEPPMVGRAYPDRTDLWNYLRTIPAPRVVVLEDLDRHPGLGSCAGEVHAQIYSALGCVGLVTNGAVRDLQAVEPMDFAFFAGSTAVSRGYFHLLEFGIPVEVGDMQVRPGDLLHGDRHGVISIPPAIARDIPVAAERIATVERRVIEVANTPNFSVADLRVAVLQSLQREKLHR
jgi:4-hydroxy-4-methyl-2-oxoglutarate aldolase